MPDKVERMGGQQAVEGERHFGNRTAAEPVLRDEGEAEPPAGGGVVGADISAHHEDLVALIARQDGLA